MGYGSWGKPKPRRSGGFEEKLFRRDLLPPWDDRWHRLSVPARAAFLDGFTGSRTTVPVADTTGEPGPSGKLTPEVLEELKGAGMVEEITVKGRTAARLVRGEELSNFVVRLRALGRYSLLNDDDPSGFVKYVSARFVAAEMSRFVIETLRDAGVEEYLNLEGYLARYVLGHRWAAWVLRKQKGPIDEKVLGVVRAAGGAIGLDELAGQVEGSRPEDVRESLDGLIARLILVEDVDPRSLDIRVGFPPAVRDALAAASRPRVRPPLVACESPRQVGPDEGLLIADLRAFLLEVASEPPRLRQDRTLFQKEIDRFEETFEPLPAWLADALALPPARRLWQALAWARYLKLVKDVAVGKAVHLHLLTAGEKWLAASPDDQVARFLQEFRAETKERDLFSEDRLLFNVSEDGGYPSASDVRFLGSNVLALRGEKGKRFDRFYTAKMNDKLPLREALDRVFSGLPEGAFFRLDSVVQHFSFGEHNPLLLGTDRSGEGLAVYLNGRAVPQLAERLEETANLLLTNFVRRRRLLPLGCVRGAVDESGGLCIAREPLLDAYFGREPASGRRVPATGQAGADASRVVVQPDFSVVIIGTSPAPAVDLIPFCERTTKGSTRGAIVLKLTREAVTKAVVNGLKPADVVARLERHATHGVPANVLREVKSWADRIRRVSPQPFTLIRCPDRETADRIMSVLRVRGERLKDTIVGFAPHALTAVERHKLIDQGIILEGPVTTPAPRAKARKKRRRYYEDDE